MNKLFFPKIGSHVVLTSDIKTYMFEANRVLRWSLKSPIPLQLSGRALNVWEHPVRFEVKAGDWYEVGSLFAPRKSWHSWEGHCMIGLKLEISKKDRKYIKERVWELARRAAVDALVEAKVSDIDMSTLNFSIRSRTIEVSSRDINDRAIVVDTREEAIALAAKIKGEAVKPAPTRWQRLET